MKTCDIKIEVQDGRIQEILDRLNAASSEIAKCYSELKYLGVLTIREKEEASES